MLPISLSPSYIWQHIEIGYVQGMCDLLAPLLVILDDGEWRALPPSPALWWGCAEGLLGYPTRAHRRGALGGSLLCPPGCVRVEWE